ncbi:hypothetical protein LEMLEM_LOCUS23608, partial [Lemmus lemmus]
EELASQDTAITDVLSQVSTESLICWQHKAPSSSFLGFFPSPAEAQCIQMCLTKLFTHSRYLNDRFCHLSSLSKTPNPLPKMTSFIHSMNEAKCCDFRAMW